MTEQAERCTGRLTYVSLPKDEQIDGIRAFIRRRYGQGEIDLVIEKDLSLKDGFILQVGSDVYDWSSSGRLSQLEEALTQAVEESAEGGEDIISLLKTEIRDFELKAADKEIGVVRFIGDGIAVIDGIEHAVYGEILLFDSGVKGMVQDIRRHETGCILFGREGEVREGSRVVRTGKMAGIPVGEAFLGRVVNALGAPLDGEAAPAAEGYRLLEEEAPAIIDRQPVNVPLETGILAIDSMFPIGRGQRELIIGDRQTGKTAIALDTILHQRGKDVICVYVAIGQKAAAVARLISLLKEKEALAYTIVVASMASDPASLQYIAPYSGTSLAEYFMYQGKDVLIVYDDLSRHAVAYRTLSLLLERSPGREAYPGDVFYLHSRLLERAARLNEEKGGGSITALPILETQGGDVSAYIPTNVISITDGQIFLESELFFAGMRPAVNVGLSVSRVGGAAQTRAMKTVSGSIRTQLAQFRELEIFTQFAADLDEASAKALRRGHILMELLKQPVGSPMTMTEQVLSLCMAEGESLPGYIQEQESLGSSSDIKSIQLGFLEFIREKAPELLHEISTAKELTAAARDQIHDKLRMYLAEQTEKGRTENG